MPRDHISTEKAATSVFFLFPAAAIACIQEQVLSRATHERSCEPLTGPSYLCIQHACLCVMYNTFVCRQKAPSGPAEKPSLTRQLTSAVRPIKHCLESSDVRLRDL